MSSKDVAISVRNLSKSYTIAHNAAKHSTMGEALMHRFKNPVQRVEKETFWALKDVSFDIQKGDVVGIIGRNGAGKSTLLKVLSRITEPTSGKAMMNGRVGSLLEVGTGFHPELTGRENIYMNGAILGMTKREITKHFDAIVDFAGVEQFLDTPVKRYSSGMYVRLAFAVAAHLEPEILVVDEVLAVGDTEFQKKCLGKMQEVSTTGRTILFVSHNMGSIATLCSRVIWVQKGNLAEDGSTSTVINNYLTNNSIGTGEISWPDFASAPGSESVRLKAVRLVVEGRISNDVPINCPLDIEIEYWNLKYGNIFNSALELRDRVGGYVLASNNRHSANILRDCWYGVSRPIGVYKTTCTIPPNFLNDTYYSIDVSVENSRGEREFFVEGAASINVVDTGEMKQEYTGSWIGAVRPKLAWLTDRLD